MNRKQIDKSKFLLGEDSVDMPAYDERGMEPVKHNGLGMYTEYPLTMANLGKIFVN